MLNYIIGSNSLGKTVYLRKLYKGYSDKLVVTNLLHADYAKVSYDNKMIQCLEETYGCDVQVGTVVLVTNLGYSQNRAMQIIESLMLKDAEVFILDEPEFGVDNEDIGVLFSILEEMRNLGKEVWVVTHNVDLILMDGIKVYTLRNDSLVEVRREDVEEVMDKI